MPFTPLTAVSTLGIILIVLAVIVVLFFIGGLLAARARARREDNVYAQHVAAADQALQEARAADRGWHPQRMEDAARAAIAESRPGWGYDRLHLILVEDRPGVDEDRAHYVAVGPDGEHRVVLAREGERWVAAPVE